MNENQDKTEKKLKRRKAGKRTVIIALAVVTVLLIALSAVIFADYKAYSDRIARETKAVSQVMRQVPDPELDEIGKKIPKQEDLKKPARKKPKEDPFKDKKVLIEGDSIQDVNFERDGESAGYFLQQAAESLGMTVTNKAVSASTLSRKHKKSVYRRIMAMSRDELAEFDYVFIAAGTNDYGYARTGKATVSRVEKDLRLIIKRIREYNEDAKIVIVSPLRRNRIRDFKTGDCDKIRTEVGNATLAEYREAIERTAESFADDDVYSISGADLATLSEIKKYTMDYLHPTYSFAEKTLAPRTVEILKDMFGSGSGKDSAEDSTQEK